MEDAKARKELDEIQREIDDERRRLAARDFELKLSHHVAIKPLLARRDEVVRSGAGCAGYWARALGSYGAGAALLPRDAHNRAAAGWMRSLEADYLPGLAYRVHVELNENEFVSNRWLTKSMRLGAREAEKTAVVWRDNRRWLVFEFFETDAEDLDVFDILYELYVNSASYFLGCRAP